jgi:hypothetical protein
VISAGSLKVLKCVSSGVGVELSVPDKISGSSEVRRLKARRVNVE